MKLTTLTGLLLAGSSIIASRPGRVLTIDDFEDADQRAASGLSWIRIADDLMGGASSVALDVVAAGTGSGRALRVRGDVAEAGFAGAWVALDGRARATDLSDFAGIRVRIRGDRVVQVGLRAGAGAGFNYMAPVEPTPDWTTVELPFDRLQGLGKDVPAMDRTSARWLGLSVGRAGHFQFDVDAVELYADRAGARVRVLDGPTGAVAFEAAPASDAPKGPWRPLAQDPRDDGKQKRLPDATEVAVCLDESHERVWFRVALAAPVPRPWLGVNLALDVDGDPGNGMAWWGTNQAFRFDRLVSVWGSATEAGYEGTIGIATAAEVEAGNFAGSSGAGVQLVLDREAPAFIVGIPRHALGATAAAPVRVVAAVGSAMHHNDDVPDSGAALVER
jgi:hypothetical protein